MLAGTCSRLRRYPGVSARAGVACSALAPSSPRSSLGARAIELERAKELDSHALDHTVVGVWDEVPEKVAQPPMRAISPPRVTGPVERLQRSRALTVPLRCQVGDLAEVTWRRTMASWAGFHWMKSRNGHSRRRRRRRRLSRQVTSVLLDIVKLHFLRFA